MGQAAFGAKVLETLSDRSEEVIAAYLPQGKAGAKLDPLQLAADQTAFVAKWSQADIGITVE